MTRTTKGNTISGVSIFLHIIDVMNAFAALAANCAGVIIALSNHVLECIVERWRIWFKRYSALPNRSIGSSLGFGSPFISTFTRTKMLPILNIRDFWIKNFSTSGTNKFSASLSGFTATFYRTKLTLFPLRWRCALKRISTIFTDFNNKSTIPSWSSLTNKIFRLPFVPAFIGAKLCSFGATGQNHEHGMTILALHPYFWLAIWMWHLISKRSTPYAARAFAHTARA